LLPLENPERFNLRIEPPLFVKKNTEQKMGCHLQGGIFYLKKGGWERAGHWGGGVGLSKNIKGIE